MPEKSVKDGATRACRQNFLLVKCVLENSARWRVTVLGMSPWLFFCTSTILQGKTSVRNKCITTHGSPSRCSSQLGLTPLGCPTSVSIVWWQRWWSDRVTCVLQLQWTLLGGRSRAILRLCASISSGSCSCDLDAEMLFAFRETGGLLLILPEGGGDSSGS